MTLCLHPMLVHVGWGRWLCVTQEYLGRSTWVHWACGCVLECLIVGGSF